MKERIDGAVFFDIDDVCDKSSPFSHMLPSPEQFSEQVGQVRTCTCTQELMRGTHKLLTHMLHVMVLLTGEIVQFFLFRFLKSKTFLIIIIMTSNCM